MTMLEKEKVKTLKLRNQSQYFRIRAYSYDGAVLLSQKFTINMMDELFSKYEIIIGYLGGGWVKCFNDKDRMVRCSEIKL